MSNFPIKTLTILVQKRFLSTKTTRSPSQSSSFTVQYLINSCGLSSKSAISTSQKLTLDETKIQNSESVLKFLKSSGLDDTHIAKLVQKHPAILRSRVKSNLIPKWEYFIQNGYTGKLLAELVVSNPGITESSLYDRIKPVFEFLKELLRSNDSVIKAVTRCNWLLTDDLKNTLKPNVDFMVKGRVPVSSIAKLLLLHPRALKQKPEKFARYFNALKELGQGPESPSFVHAFKVIFQMRESTFSKKVEALKSLGWTQEDKFETSLQNPESFLSLLKSTGLDDTHIAKLVQKCPAILLPPVERNLISKWEYLIQNGYTGKLLAELVASNPRITESFSDHIKPSFEFLKEILGSNDSVIKAVTSCKWLLTTDLKNSFKPNVGFMMKGGVPVSSINKLILWNPRALMRKPEDFALDFNAVKELSLEPEAPLFVRALRVMTQMSESTLSKKVKVFKSLGWTQEDIVSMFRGNPTCLACSEEKIRRTMDFFVNTVKFEREFIIAHPFMISNGLDKMHRRYNILKVLESKKLLKWNNKVSNLLTVMGEKTFLKYYVGKYKTIIPGLEEMYHGAATRDKLDS